jgi:hypothetical protein
MITPVLEMRISGVCGVIKQLFLVFYRLFRVPKQRLTMLYFAAIVEYQLFWYITGLASYCVSP